MLVGGHIFKLIGCNTIVLRLFFSTSILGHPDKYLLKDFIFITTEMFSSLYIMRTSLQISKFQLSFVIARFITGSNTFNMHKTQ